MLKKLKPKSVKMTICRLLREKKRIRLALIAILVFTAVLAADWWFVTGFLHTPKSVVGSWLIEGDVAFYVQSGTGITSMRRINEDDPSWSRVYARNFFMLNEIHFYSDGTGLGLLSDGREVEFEWGNRQSRTQRDGFTHQRGRIWITAGERHAWTILDNGTLRSGGNVLIISPAGVFPMPSSGVSTRIGRYIRAD